MIRFGIEDLIPYILLVVWIGLIIYLSSGKNSVLRTLPIFIFVLKPLFSNADPEEIGRYHVYFRKSVHLFGYAILATIASIAFFKSTSTPFVAEYWHVTALAVTLAVATLDETLQYFDPERVGSVRDVALDCSGGALAILFFWLVCI